MSGGKETPRQKMIGMMYLVLTALLALNVSKEILNAFVIVENGLNTTNKNFDGKNGVLYSKFEKAMAEDKAKTEPWYKKAMIVKQKSLDLCKIIDDIRSDLYIHVQKDIKSKAEADTFKLAKLDSKDNFDIPTHELLGENPEDPKPDAPAIKLKEAIIKFKKDVIELIPVKEKAFLKVGLSTDDVYSFSDDKKVHWEFNNFDHTTMAADMCIFAALKNDVKNTESDIVGTLLKEIDAGNFKFDKVVAKVVAPTSYITLGEEYNADIFIAAYSSTSNPKIQIGDVDTAAKTMRGTPIDVPVEAGLGKYTVRSTTEGTQNFSGIINLKAPDGTIAPYTFSSSYTVARPAFAVSPTKMNVFYIGVPNPVDISAAGAAPANVVATLSGAGSIANKGQGHYEVTVSSGSECSINVAIKDPKSGTTKSMGAPAKFRVRKVPNPNAKFANIVGDGAVSLGELNAASGLFADLSDFVFDLKFPVTAWTVSMSVNGLFQDQSTKGPMITPAMKDLLKKAKKGSKVLIEGVHVQAPDGDRKIAGCNIKIK